MWLNFHQRDPKQQEWYFQSVANYTKELEDTLAYKEYLDLMKKLFKGE